MGKKNQFTMKSLLATMTAAVMIMLSVVVAPPTTVQAASKPTLTKTTRNIFEGNSYDLNIKDKIKGSAYKWTTSNKKVAIVDSKGVVKGVNQGKATITCTVKAPKKTYKLTCKVTIFEEATGFKIKNKVSALNEGQVYDLNRTIIPSTSNEKTTWSSSDKSIAAPDKLGKFTALRQGTVKITGKTTGGLKDSVTIKVVDKDGTVATQKELDALLGNGVSLITVKTSEAVDFKIPEGNYSGTKLVVDAPKADVTNQGVFRSVDIKNIKPATWTELAIGNILNISAPGANVVLGNGASASINVQRGAGVLTIVNNGTLTGLTINTPANVILSGIVPPAPVPVIANVQNARLTSNIPLALTSNQQITLVLQSGAEGTTVTAPNSAAVPAILGSIPVAVIVGGTSSDVDPTLPTSGGGSSGGGNTGGGTDTDFVDGVKVTPGSGSTTYELQKPINSLKSITVSYPFIGNFKIEGEMLTTFLRYLSNESGSAKTWQDTTGAEKTYTSDNKTVNVHISATEDSNTKVVALTYGELEKNYTVTIQNGAVTVNTGSSTPYTITKSGTKVLTISPSPQGLIFKAEFNN